ncbi:MAG TPA: translocation/assembly module TamB [Gemmatimonadaceae bacterium]|nr:translocation/assembly module TamB [Gemmatimonadaceae bacterium]
MSRRRLVAIMSASIILFLGLVVVAMVVAITQTPFGRERVRDYVMARLKSSLGKRGSLYVGTIGGNLFTGIEIDSLELRDEEDSLFVATGPVSLRFDPRDVVDKRLRISYLEVVRPFVNLRRHADRSWNFKHIFPSSPSKPAQSLVERARRAQETRFGDLITIDSAVIRGGTVVLTEPWQPPDSLEGARRDSAVKVALASDEHEIRRSSEGLKQTRRWTHLELRSPGVRIADPTTPGRLVQIGRLSVTENDPPFRFRNAQGEVRIMGDSVWFELARFALPGSAGSAKGKVWWGGDDPTRYDVHVVGDTVSLSDVDWIHPGIPRNGGGQLNLTIRNSDKDLHVLEYAISDMDVRSTGSHLRGDLTFGVGGPVLVVKDVALDLSPMDFDLLRSFNGGDFPVDWQGTFTGHVHGRGGPINRWIVDDAHLVFRDAHVPGAVSEITARGGLDILFPSLAKFRDLHVNARTVDLRTPRYLFPDFPRLAGTISGTATLDSIWTDVRFHDADLTHHDGPGLPSHFTGSGRVTYGEEAIAFDVDMLASPLSLTTLARSYPMLELRGPYEGSIRAQGTLGDMGLALSLAGAGGQMTVDGRFDFAEPGYAARGTGSVAGLDARTLLERPELPPSWLTGSYSMDVVGDSLPNLAGSAIFDLDSAHVDSLDVGRSTAALSFGGGRMSVDTLRLATTAANIEASGGLGLAKGVVDTLHFTVAVDSLGGLRPYLLPGTGGRSAVVADAGLSFFSDDTAAAPSAEELQRAIADSLAGRLESRGTLVGSIADLEARGSLAGRGLFAAGNSARALSGDYRFGGLPHDSRGSLKLELDSLLVGSVRLDTVKSVLEMRNRSSGALGVEISSSDPLGSFRGGTRASFERMGDSLVVALDSAGLSVADAEWALAGPAHAVLDTNGVWLDSLVLRSSTGGMLALRGDFPERDSLRATFVADSVPLAHLGALAQSTDSLRGFASFSALLSGVREWPVLHLDGRFAGLRYGDLRFPFFTVRGEYRDRRLASELAVYRNGRTALEAEANLPVNLALARVPQRLLDDSLSGRVVADSVDLAIIEAVAPQFDDVRGAASTHLTIGGTWEHPYLSGDFQIRNGIMGVPDGGITLRDVNADIAFLPDSVKIQRLSMASGSQSNSQLSLTGSIAVPDYSDRRTLGFDLSMHARSFEAVDRKSLARIEISGALQLGGTFERPILGGTMTIDRGTLYISDISQKQVVNLNDPEFYNIVDTSLVANRGLLEALPPDLDSAISNLRVPSLDVRIGDDVWLRSQEANIKLAGNVDISKQGNQRLESGTLRVSRGTYRLDLGVVQRTFQVDSGYVTFYGDPNIPAELDVRATYTVRQASRESGQDVKIVAHIGGTLAQPRLELSSEERIPLSNTEILSYLVFGQPSFVSASNDDSSLRPVAAALLPSMGAVLERALADQISFIDYVQVQTGGTGEQFSGQGYSTAANVLSGTRIGVGKQVGERTFLTVNAGLCGLGGLGGSQATGASFEKALGVTIEHRLNDGFSVQASMEPSSAALQCRPGLGASDIGNRPPQYGFDIFREWSF